MVERIGVVEKIAGIVIIIFLVTLLGIYIYGSFKPDRQTVIDDYMIHMDPIIVTPDDSLLLPPGHPPITDITDDELIEELIDIFETMKELEKRIEELQKELKELEPSEDNLNDFLSV